MNQVNLRNKWMTRAQFCVGVWTPTISWTWRQAHVCSNFMSVHRLEC